MGRKCGTPPSPMPRTPPCSTRATSCCASSDTSARWQSFDAPSDTILPSQVLSLGTELRASLMDTDYSSGRFKLKGQEDGDLEFYTVAVLSGFEYGSYWASGTTGDGKQLVFDKSGSIYLALNNATGQFNLTSAGMGYSPGDFYQRATLDPDGVFRQFVYPKNATSSGGRNAGWTVVDFQPPDICRAIRLDTGSGACGFNSYCSSGGNQSVDCVCPPHYSFLEPNRKYRGCVPDFTAQSCDGDGSEAAFDLQEMINVDWPLADYEHFSPVDESECRNECLSDCFCAVAIYNGGDCWKKKLPLTNGKRGSFVQRTAFIKVPRGNSSRQPQSPPTVIREKEKRRTWILVGSLLLGSSAFVNLILLTVIIMAILGSYSTRTRKRPQPHLGTSKPVGLRSMTYAELEEATNGFSEEVGRGASGVVYKGYLQTEPGTCVAVKKIDKLSSDAEKEFSSEVKAIGQTYHKNLVRLLGFCSEGPARLLVYEFMSNGPLTDFLFGGAARPRWDTRAKIALGIARGLLYLHEECSSQIIHCDIKPQNVLLDDNLVARISDFGLAKLLRTDQSQTETGIRGTRGYVAPEWFKSSQITAKVDVYSFGVMLLEIVCRRRNVEPEAGNEERSILTFWATDCYRCGRLDLLVEGDEEAGSDMSRVERFVAVGLWCIQEEPSLRPTMQRVTQMLDGAALVPAPPEPFHYISSSISPA